MKISKRNTKKKHVEKSPSGPFPCDFPSRGSHCFAEEMKRATFSERARGQDKVVDVDKSVAVSEQPTGFIMDFSLKKKRALIAPFTPCKRARRVADNNLIQPTPSLHQAHYGREKRRDFPYRTRLTLSKLFSSDLYVDSLFYSRTYSELHQVPIDCKLLLSFRHSRMGSLRPDEGDEACKNKNKNE